MLSSFETLLDRFEEQWKAGNRPVLADFLPSPQEAHARELAWELIHIDMWYRAKQGETGVLAELYGKLPGFAFERAALQKLEQQVRQEVSQGTSCGRTSVSDPPSPLPIPVAPQSLLSPSQGPEEIGRLGPYRVLKLLGAGGMGMVFQAEDPQLRRMLALKVMKPELAASASARERFLREARAAAASTMNISCPSTISARNAGFPSW